MFRYADIDISYACLCICIDKYRGKFRHNISRLYKYIYINIYTNI